MVSSRTTSTTRISAPHAKHCITRTHRYRTKPISGAERGRTVKTSRQIDSGCGRGGTHAARAARATQRPDGGLPPN
jgi:hypothetical protein